MNDDLPRISVSVGQVHASREPTVAFTVLGSCVSACLYDAVLGIGGMNHFLLPGESPCEPDAARYGIHAMERLINSLMKLGADRRRLQAKAFGGADLLGFGTCRVGTKNRTFITHFLEVEGIPLIAHRLGGSRPLQVRFHTTSGKALVRPLRTATGTHERIAADEVRFQRGVARELDESGDYILFND
jgi:chemotaxis receptor (MCP) glutamine deamidase CheD